MFIGKLCGVKVYIIQRVYKIQNQNIQAPPSFVERWYSC